MNLTPQEAVLLRALCWEERHLMMDGPAHRFCEKHGLKKHDAFAIVSAAKFDLTFDDLEGDQIFPNGWPWPQKTVEEIIAHLKTKKDANVSPK